VRDVKAYEHLQLLLRVLLDKLTDFDVVGPVDGVFEPGGPDDVILDVVECVLFLLEHVLFGDEHEEEVLAGIDQPLLEVGDQSLVFVH